MMMMMMMMKKCGPLATADTVGAVAKTMKIVAINVVASRAPNGDRLHRPPLVPIVSLFVKVIMK